MKVEVTIGGIPNQLFSQGMRAYQMWDEARKLFAALPGRKRHPDVSVMAKDLGLADVSLGEFLTSKFALWLDLRTTDDDRLHGSGRRIENASEGVTDHSDNEKNRGSWRFEHLPLHHHGRPPKP